MKLDAVTERFVKLERRLASLEEELSIKNNQIAELNLRLKTLSDVVTSRDTQLYEELKHDIKQLELDASFNKNSHIPGDKILSGRIDMLTDKLSHDMEAFKTHVLGLADQVKFKEQEISKQVSALISGQSRLVEEQSSLLSYIDLNLNIQGVKNQQLFDDIYKQHTMLMELSDKVSLLEDALNSNKAAVSSEIKSEVYSECGKLDSKLAKLNRQVKSLAQDLEDNNLEIQLKKHKLEDLSKFKAKIEEGVTNSLKQYEHKLLIEIDRLRAKAEEAVNALDTHAFDTFKAAVKIALETQRKDNLKDLSRLNARVDKLKVSFSKLLDDLRE